MTGGLLLVLIVLANPSSRAFATAWAVKVGATTTALGQAQPGPAAPATVTSACGTTSGTVTLTWSVVTPRTSSTVSESTTSATGTYTTVASGITSTSYTTGTLTKNTNYWFKVTTVLGSNWSSTASSASAERSLNGSSTCS